MIREIPNQYGFVSSVREVPNPGTKRVASDTRGTRVKEAILF
jgi:hypothetical protein